LNNGHYYPIAYFLLPDKKFESYQNAFNGLIKQCNKFNFNFKPDVIFVDFEITIHKANLAIGNYKRLQVPSRSIVVAKNTIFRVKYGL